MIVSPYAQMQKMPIAIYASLMIRQRLYLRGCPHLQMRIIPV